MIGVAWMVIAVSLLGCSAFAEVTETFKIVNWNVLYGFNHKKSVKQGANWIKKQAADVVALQELNGHNQTGFRELAAEWRHDHSAILKKGGFPVGLTSNQPIEVIERRVKDFHHGYLHCKTHGIHFFVVHFWPGKYWEADWILDKTAPLIERGEKVIILGDFNGNSRKDEDFLIANATLRKRDYTFVDKVEAKGFVDIVHKHDPEAKISQPSSITIPRWTKDLKELKLKRYRIDFVFADKSFAEQSHSGTISLAREIETISDHYPVIVEFNGALSP
ncbi:MAG: endonuclease/exonuclease/phosphatase family protein [Limisphaerales bacterium]